MHGCPLRLGPYLEVDCMNQSETNFSRTAQSKWFWQGAICNVWTFQLDKHWRHSQKERLTYNLVDFAPSRLFGSCCIIPTCGISTDYFNSISGETNGQMVKTNASTTLNFH